MPIQPHELIECAIELLNKKNEAHNRAAVSRAYYACYHKAKPQLEYLDPPPRSGQGGVHENLIRTLEHASATQVKGIGYRLRQLRSLRVAADYEIDDAFGPNKAQAAVGDAKTIYEEIALIE